MAANAEWEVATELLSPEGSLFFNDPTGFRYILVPQACDMGADLRVTKDNITQFDGSIFHRRWTTGYQCQLTLQLWKDTEPACDQDVREMIDTVNLYAFALLNAGDNQGRLLWQPTGYGDRRMLDDIRLLERVTASVTDEGVTVMTFAVDTVYPYAQDLTQITSNILASASGMVTNVGTATYWPVFQVNGPLTSFTLSNDTEGLNIVYDATLATAAGLPAVGGGDYIEIDTFRGTAFLNGSGSDMLPGFDWLLTDFWGLGVGTTTWSLVGATDVDMLWAAAWA